MASPNIIVSKYTEEERKIRKKRKIHGHTFNSCDQQELIHDFRCPICGRWISYNRREQWKFVMKRNWDFLMNTIARCGTHSTCEDYYQEWLKTKSKKWHWRQERYREAYLREYHYRKIHKLERDFIKVA